VRVAEGVEFAAAQDAEARLEAARGIIDAGMDDFAVARRGFLADSLAALQNDDGAAGARQRARGGEADGPRANDDGVDIMLTPKLSRLWTGAVSSGRDMR